MSFVDLRSDTVTRPTTEMRKAMADAVVGDDAYGEDPTVNELQEVFAARVGKEAALFVPSGTMGNQIALRVLAPPASSVVVGSRQHVLVYENGAGALNAGIQFHPVDDADGTLQPSDIEWAIAAGAHHYPTPSLVCIENTHMPANGAPWPLAKLAGVAGAAKAGGLALHLDGARLFNAEVAEGVTAATLASYATTVMCCMSKGLCAPVGSLLAGTAEDVAAARVERQRLGGGMRQAGVLAAAGLVALRSMIERLADDHVRAARLGDVVADRWSAGGYDPAAVRTNVVTFRPADPKAVIAHLKSEGVLAGTISPGIVRLVTHHDVDDDGVERAIKALAGAPA